MSLRIGELPQQDVTSLTSIGRWGDNDWSFHGAPDSRSLVQALGWAAGAGANFSVSFVSDGATYSASFDRDGLFETPVQPNLARCGH